MRRRSNIRSTHRTVRRVHRRRVRMRRRRILLTGGLVAIAVVLRIDYENRQLMHGGRV